MFRDMAAGHWRGCGGWGPCLCPAACFSQSLACMAAGSSSQPLSSDPADGEPWRPKPAEDFWRTERPGGSPSTQQPAGDSQTPAAIADWQSVELPSLLYKAVRLWVLACPAAAEEALGW